MKGLLKKILMAVCAVCGFVMVFVNVAGLESGTFTLGRAIVGGAFGIVMILVAMLVYVYFSLERDYKELEKENYELVEENIKLLDRVTFQIEVNDEEAPGGYDFEVFE